ncbi:MAG: hypothetical protein JW804_02125 [Sedimentisphaerales bacterium]|nr:hypothetical protein [Sedimentisphaerales bacterium]
MTKKIQCKIIDSTPLSADEPVLHLGWDFNSSIYFQPEQNQATRSANKDISIDSDQTGSILDCYA